MSFLGLCDDDPIVSTLEDILGSNIVRVPEERIQPVSVIASNGQKSAFRGALGGLLVGDTNLNLSPVTTVMSDLSGKRSKKVSFDLGFTILDGFLGGFGIPSAGIKLNMNGATEVSFTFKDVQRTWVDVGLLGRTLVGRKIDKQNPAATIFFGDSDYSFVLIDSVITSSDFAISVDKSDDQNFKLNIPAIQNIVSQANVGVTVSTTSGYDLIFKGSKHLGFAFSCVRLYLSEDGTITAMPPEDKIPAITPSFVKMNKPSYHRVIYSPDRILLNKKPGMISWDDVIHSDEERVKVIEDEKDLIR